MSANTNNQPKVIGTLSADFYERLFSGAGLPIFVCDLKGRIEAVNPLGAELLPARAGLTLRDLLPPEAHEAYDESVAALLRSQEPLEFRLRLPGLERDTEWATWMTPLPDADGKLARIVVWFHDITSRMQVRRSLRQRERLTSLGVLSGAVAHHYNNLLCCIATSLEFAMNMNTLTATRRALQRTADAARRATDLTQQLLAFAQGDYRAEHQADLLETVLFFFDENEKRLAERMIRLDLTWDLIPTRAIPREQMMIVLTNLTANAREAMPDGGTLHVTIGLRDENHVRLAIADSGSGIGPEHLEHIFEPFFTTKGVLGEGSSRQVGMGLAVAHGLIAEMHGTISVSNLPAGGARFEIVLPLHDE